MEAMWIYLVPLYAIVSWWLRAVRLTLAHCLAPTRINPTQPVYEIATFVHLVAELRVVLVNVEREERGVDGCVRI